MQERLLAALSLYYNGDLELHEKTIATSEPCRLALQFNEDGDSEADQECLDPDDMKTVSVVVYFEGQHRFIDRLQVGHS